ncbi:hypothetical protein [Leptospira interrogans]|nr:hypothetical protein [Leptospira interrogans]
MKPERVYVSDALNAFLPLFAKEVESRTHNLRNIFYVRFVKPV